MKFSALIFLFLFPSFLSKTTSDTDFTGYATAKVTENSILSISCVGFADKENQINYDTTTIQNVGSLSKTFIGLSLMIAKDKGLIDLDKNINEYLDFEVKNPYFKKGNNFITLRHLATHTSGIIDNPKIYETSYSEGKIPKIELGVFLKEYLSKEGKNFSKKNFNKAKTGTYYTYSNIGSALAAYILEKATGMPFDEFTKKNIFEPLKMNHSGWSYQQINEQKHAVLYDEDDKPLPIYTLITYPDGGLRTCILDLSIYMQELIKGYNHHSKLLSNEAWDELYRKNFDEKNSVKNIDPREPNIGIFMFHSKKGMIGHTGSDPGASSFFCFNPSTNIGYIFMANEDLTKENVGRFKEIWTQLNDSE